VLFECGLRINKHVQETARKCRNLFNILAKVAKAKWGFGQAAIRTLYKGMFQPMTTYVTAGWSDFLNGKTMKILIKLQRMALLQVTKA
jgi:hypothetical protein